MPFASRTLMSVLVAFIASVVPTGCAGPGAGEGEGEGAPCALVEDLDGDCSVGLASVADAGALGLERDHHATWTAEVEGATFLYVLGGVVDMSSAARAIERAAVLDDGSLEPFESAGQATASTFSVGAGAASLDDTAILTGGLRVDAQGRLADPSPAVTVARAASDGSLAFSDGPALPFPTFHGQAVAAGGRIYVVGGMHTGSAQTDRVVSASLADGVLAAWRDEASLPSIRSHHGLATDGRHFFVTGGLDADPTTNPDARTDVWSARIGADGQLEPWRIAGALPAPQAVHASFVAGDALFVIGGIYGSEATADVLRATVAADGTVSAFEIVGSLPAPRAHVHQAPRVGSSAYFVGGATIEGIQHHSHGEAWRLTLE